MVVGFHASITYPLTAAWGHQVAELGNTGVQLFFLVSAVTMCYMWQQRRDEMARAPKFYIRRFFRIAPLFWCAIVFYTYLWHVTPDYHLRDITPLDIGLTAAFLHPFSASAINSVVPGGWSIGIEMGFYALFPFLARFQGTQVLAIGLVMFLLLGLLGTTYCERLGSGEQYSTFLYYSFLTQLPIFPVGMFVYSLALREPRIDLRPALAVIVVWLAVAFAGKFAFHLTARPFFWCEVFLLAALVDATIRWNVQFGILGFFGRLSYSMYLFHFAVLYFLEKLFGNHWPYWIGLPVALAVTAVLAMLSRATAEKWSQDAGRALLRMIWSGTESRRLAPPQSP
jgi:exopolysaccharide production protein ExoZ